MMIFYLTVFVFMLPWLGGDRMKVGAWRGGWSGRGEEHLRTMGQCPSPPFGPPEPSARSYEPPAMTKTKPLQLFVVYAALSLVIYTINIDKGAVPLNEASPASAGDFKSAGSFSFYSDPWLGLKKWLWSLTRAQEKVIKSLSLLNDYILMLRALNKKYKASITSLPLYTNLIKAI